MWAGLVLNYDNDEAGGKPLAYIEELLDRWIDEYKKIAEQYPEKKKRCEYFMGRVLYAARMQSERVSEDDSNAGYDDTYYAYIAKLESAEEEQLDGDFPLGETSDAHFAAGHFSMREQTLIQCGLAEVVDPSENCTSDDKISARRAFLDKFKDK